MTTLNFIFSDLPKALLQNPNRIAKWESGVEKDIASEMENYGYANISWKKDITDSAIILTIDVITPTEGRFLQCALHNLHGARLIQ